MTEQQPIDSSGEKFDKAPIRPGLERKYDLSYTNNEILFHAKAGDLVVRAQSIDGFYDLGELTSPENDQKVVETVRKYCKQAEGMFEELQTKYHILMPKFQYVLGQQRLDRFSLGKSAGRALDRQIDDLQPALYVVTEKIVGNDLAVLGRNDKHPSLEQNTELYSQFTRYWADKYISGEAFLTDFGIGWASFREQFTFGHIVKPGDPPDKEYQDQIYLHDVDPNFWSPYKSERNTQTREELLNELIGGIIESVGEIREYQPELNVTPIKQAIGQEIQRVIEAVPNQADNLQGKLRELEEPT